MASGGGTGTSGSARLGSGQSGQTAADTRSDAELLRRHWPGTDAFGLLFRRHKDRLWAVALRIACDPDDAADALQEAMISAFRRADDFRGESAVTTWLHRIVVNASLDLLRRRAARRSVGWSGDPDELPVPEPRQPRGGQRAAPSRTPGSTWTRRCAPCRRRSGPRSSWWTCSATRWRMPPRSSASPRAR